MSEEGRYSDPIKARLVRRSEDRREKFYRLVRLHLSGEGPVQTEAVGIDVDLGIRYTEVLPRTGGPVAWKYLPPRCFRMLRRNELNLEQAKVCAQFVYLVQMNWLLRGPGTNYPKNEKVNVSQKKMLDARMGQVFPAHLVPPKVMAILHAALIEEVAFKDFPHIGAGSRMTRHRMGKRYFLGSITLFNRVLTR